MFITRDEIEELTGLRPYEELPDGELASLLDAFQDFLPSIESYGESADEALESYPGLQSGSLPEALTLPEVVEPSASRALYEILLEVSLRELAAEGSAKHRYAEWNQRGFFYGFDETTLEAGAKILLAKL